LDREYGWSEASQSKKSEGVFKGGESNLQQKAGEVNGH